MSGFDIAGATAKWELIIVGDRPQQPTRLMFSANRISNCDADFNHCLWSDKDPQGRPRQGGVLLALYPAAIASVISNNVIENLRGFLFMVTHNGSAATTVAHNTFRNIRLWSNNNQEIVHLGAVPVVRAPQEEPTLSRENALVADNVFERVSVGVALIGVKSAGNQILRNYIVDSRSSISLRDGSDTLIENNTIIRSNGIRIMGDRQVVRNNRIMLPTSQHAIWFENGAPQAGYECTARSTAGLTIYTRSQPLRWLYRQARSPQVYGNVIVVHKGKSSSAIALRNEPKSCGFVECGIKPVPISCDKQLSKEEFAAIVSPGSGNVVREIATKDDQ